MEYTTRSYFGASLNQTLLLNCMIRSQTPLIQPSLCLHDLCLDVLSVLDNELCLFRTKAFPLIVLLCYTPGIGAVRTIVHAFSYVSVLGRDQNLSPSQQLLDLLHFCHSRGFVGLLLCSKSLFACLCVFSVCICVCVYSLNHLISAYFLQKALLPMLFNSLFQGFLSLLQRVLFQRIMSLKLTIHFSYNKDVNIH